MYFRQLNPKLGNQLGLWLLLQHIQFFILMHISLLTLHFTGFTNVLLLHRTYLFCVSHFFSVQYTMALPCFSPRSLIPIWLWSMDSYNFFWIYFMMFEKGSFLQIGLHRYSYAACLRQLSEVCNNLFKNFSIFEFSYEMHLLKLWVLVGVPSRVCQLTPGVALSLIKVSAWWNMPVLFRQDSEFYV